MNTYQENFAKAFDVNEIQENFKTMFDAEKIQTSLKDFYNVENLKDLYNVEKFQENVNKLFAGEAFSGVRNYTESFGGQEQVQEQVQKGVKLGANVIAANTNAVTDAVTLKAIQVREGVEGALKQAYVLASAKDIKAAADAQQSYVEALQKELTESAWMNVGLVAGLVETNLNIAKEAIEQVKSAQKAA